MRKEAISERKINGYKTDFRNFLYKAIILPIEEYEKMKEGLHDLVIVAERCNEKAISFKELKRKI